MRWASDEDSGLAQNDSALGELEIALMLGTHDPATAAHVVQGAGCQLVLRALASGHAACLAVVPDGTFSLGDVPADKLFAERWPETWRTKRTARKEAATGRAGYEAGWACGRWPGRGAGVPVAVARVTEFDGATLLRVQMRPDAPDVAANATGITTWWPVGDHAAGWEVLWARGVTEGPNYGILVQWARKAAQGRAERPAKAGQGKWRRDDLTREEQSRRARKAWETRRLRASLPRDE